LICAPGKSGIFLCKWHIKLQGPAENQLRISLRFWSLPVQAQGLSARMGFDRQRPAARYNA